MGDRHVTTDEEIDRYILWRKDIGMEINLSEIFKAAIREQMANDYEYEISAISRLESDLTRRKERLKDLATKRNGAKKDEVHEREQFVNDYVPLLNKSVRPVADITKIKHAVDTMTRKGNDPRQWAKGSEWYEKLMDVLG